MKFANIQISMIYYVMQDHEEITHRYDTKTSNINLWGIGEVLVQIHGTRLAPPSACLGSSAAAKTCT
uniref:Uncharacterized protein n=1 Tax=Meloidogyne incognita TaxID=6306 RepID=A0A914MA13_MELIC